MPQIINLDLCKQDNAQIIKQLVQYSPNVSQFSCGERYVFIDTHTTAKTTFSLGQILLRLPNAPQPEEQLVNSYAVIGEHHSHSESSILERPVLGIWTISQYEATFENKSASEHEYVLKTAFFPTTIGTQDITPYGKLSIDDYARICDLTKTSLIQAQEISNSTPHMAPIYPPIENTDGVHLLMQQYRAIPIKALSSWLRENPQGLTFIQRLLICIDLYRMYDKARSASALLSDRQQLLYRDVQSTNIKVINNDFMLTSYVDSLKLSAVTLSSDNATTEDLCSLALMCAELWGDHNCTNITTREELTKINYFVEPERLLQGVTGYPEEERDYIHVILLILLRPQKLPRAQTERGLTNPTDTAYIDRLLDVYKQLSTPHLALQKRINALKLKLVNYSALTSELRAKLDKEFVAADFLIHHPQALVDFPEECSLADIWINYCQNQLNTVLSINCTSDTPPILMAHVARIKKACTYPLMPNHHILQSILAEWSIISRMLDLFKQARSIDAKAISTLFNIQLQANNSSNLEDMEATIKQSIKKNLANRLGLDQANQPYKNLFFDLCNRVVEPVTQHPNNIIDTPSLVDEWAMALQLLAHSQGSNDLAQPEHEAVVQPGTLVNLWRSYRDSQQNLILNTKLPTDTPSPLLTQLMHLQSRCQKSPIDHHTLPAMTATLSRINECSELFERLKFINPAKIAAFFNAKPDADSSISLTHLKSALQKYLHDYLKACCVSAQLPDHYNELILKLSTEAVESTGVSVIDTPFMDKWAMAQQLLALRDNSCDLTLLEENTMTQPRTLVSLWRAYRDTQQNLILNTELPLDTPPGLSLRLAQLKNWCSKNSPDHHILPTVIVAITRINEVSELFQRLKFINPLQIAAFFTAKLDADSSISLTHFNSALQKYLHDYLKACCGKAQLPNHYYGFALKLATEAMELTTVSAIEFSNDWLLLMQLLDLNKRCVALGINNDPKSTAPTSLVSAFNALYYDYQHYVTESLNQALASYNKELKSPPSPGLFTPAPQRKQTIEQLYTDLALLFHNRKSQTATIPQAIIQLVEKTKHGVQQHHQQGLFASLQLTQSKLVIALEQFLVEFKNSHEIGHTLQGPRSM